MEVTSIQNGIIIDHVPAGTSLKVLEYLKIDPAKTKLALIMNADSKRYGSKDIIKIEDDKDIDLDVLGFVARQATVDVVRGGKIVEKKQPNLPEHIVGVISCVNPRCVTTAEPGIKQMFHSCTPSGSNTAATTATRKPNCEHHPTQHQGLEHRRGHRPVVPRDRCRLLRRHLRRD